MGVLRLQAEEKRREDLAPVYEVAAGHLHRGGRAPQGHRKFAELGVHVEADAQHDPVDLVLLAGDLHEDAADLAVADEEVVGPLDLHRGAGERFDRLSRCGSRDQGEQVRVFHRHGRPQEHGEQQTLARR